MSHTNPLYSACSSEEPHWEKVLISSSSYCSILSSPAVFLCLRNSIPRWVGLRRIDNTKKQTPELDLLQIKDWQILPSKIHKGPGLASNVYYLLARQSPFWRLLLFSSQATFLSELKKAHSSKAKSSLQVWCTIS